MTGSAVNQRGAKGKSKRGHQKRRRLTSACTTCHSRKVKCSGDRPSCVGCLKANGKCHWPEGDQEEHEGENTTLESIEDLLNATQRDILMKIFFQTPHLVIVRHSILLSTFKGMEINQEAAFLSISIFCLSAIYVPESAVLKDFNGEAAATLSQRLAMAAQRYSRATSDRPTVKSTQANVILGLRELLCRTGYKAWMYTGLAIRMSQALRLGREYHQEHPTSEQEVRRRTMWACFVMDRLVSSVCSRPQTLRSIKLSVQLPCPDENFEFDVSQQLIWNLKTGPNPNNFDVMPYFIKAIEHWGIMSDLFATGVSGLPSKVPTDPSSEFYQAEQAAMAWKANLPASMRWSWANYKKHQRFERGSLFVSLHFIINHALCIAHQEYLPEFEGDRAFDDTASLLTPPFGPSSTSSYDCAVVRTCLKHADEITRMASALHCGDASDREMLRAPYVGLALESAARCHLWRMHQSSLMPSSVSVGVSGDAVTSDPNSTSTSTSATAATAAAAAAADSDANDKALAEQKLKLLLTILESWEGVWPIASAWRETTSLLSLLYEASQREAHTTIDQLQPQSCSDNDNDGNGDGDDDNDRHGDDAETPQILDAAAVVIGSGYPHPQNINSYRLFDDIRLIIMTAADPSGLRHRQTRLHIETLWTRMRLLRDLTAAQQHQLATVAVPFDHFSSLDGMPNYADDFQGFE